MANSASATVRDAITTVGNPEPTKRDFLKLVTGFAAGIGTFYPRMGLAATRQGL